MARYSRERSRLGTLSGAPAGVSFLSPTLVMVHPPNRVADGTRRMHLSLGLGLGLPVPNGADGGFLDRRSYEPHLNRGRRVNFL